ncbi:hypothetical protein SAMN04515647_2811 [Cohaesibacter sp. ES.047]|uniref:DUF2066 domain-containing protein n=1 Tax=Cohaesibacter sp. ES.047 TaxID=1798205 RepID=UPI000BC0EDE9|nr:DUF2066 domain-containing protein [Cohaesibacter sp. ES.047]SNY92539.1 hypothetical protein SAMN04515647_2811 [Cohaesibacter sp. ES.047]
MFNRSPSSSDIKAKGKRSETIARFMILFSMVWSAQPVAASELSTETAKLYQATTIITGETNLSERARGIRECFELVLSKVSGRQHLMALPALMAARKAASDYVDHFTYLDRKKGIQISDEQGTRDRSFLFTVAFRRDDIDALLAREGVSPWLAGRPTIGIDLTINDGMETYRLTQTSKRGWGQRAVIESLEGRTAVSLHLPSSNEAASGAKPVMLTGRMDVTKQGYWSSSWALLRDGEPMPLMADNQKGLINWSVDIGTFDKVLADAVWASVEMLSAAPD